MSGSVDCLELLFPGGSMDEAEAVYADAPAMQLYNSLAVSAIKTLIYDNVAEQPYLRLFEIGGGTGGAPRT